jgi:hypothetical protein
MQNLEKRITELEKASSTSEGPTTIVIRFLSAGNLHEEIQTLKDWKGDQQWKRQPGETEQALIDRATKEVSRNGSGCTMLLQVD